LPSALLLAACFEANPLVGVACDPASASCPAGQACIASEGGFACLPEGTPPVIDAPPPPPSCDPDDPKLNICFGFDQEALPSSLANEGRAPVRADLVNVTRTTRGTGGAAQIDTTSSIFIPPDASLEGIVAIEASIRLDVAVPAGMRVGVLDSEATSLGGFSVFVFGGPAVGEHRLRCNIGGMDLFVDLPIVVGAWVDVGCSCAADVVSAFVDGAKVGETSGCQAAVASQLGLQIGQNSNANAGLPKNEELIGAIDDVRLRN
jgi:hypothetical protein